MCDPAWIAYSCPGAFDAMRRGGGLRVGEVGDSFYTSSLRHPRSRYALNSLHSFHSRCSLGVLRFSVWEGIDVQARLSPRGLSRRRDLSGRGQGRYSLGERGGKAWVNSRRTQGRQATQTRGRSVRQAARTRQPRTQEVTQSRRTRWSSAQGDTSGRLEGRRALHSR